MHSIISFQKKKDYGQILFEIQNEQSFLDYRRREKISNYIYYTLGVALFLLNLSLVIVVLSVTNDESDWYWKSFNSFTKTGGVIHLIIQIVNTLIMMITMIVLILKLKKFHV